MPPTEDLESQPALKSAGHAGAGSTSSGVFGVDLAKLSDINEVQSAHNRRSFTRPAFTPPPLAQNARACQLAACPFPRVQHKRNDAWEELGGLPGVAAALRVSLHDGVSPAAADGTDLESRRCAVARRPL